MSEDKESEICKIAVQIVEQLGFTGLLRIDFIVDECSEKVYVLELNTVIVTGYKGSAYPFFKKQGIDIAEVMISNSSNYWDWRHEDEKVFFVTYGGGHVRSVIPVIKELKSRAIKSLFSD